MKLIVLTLFLTQSISAYGFSLDEPGDCLDFSVGDCTVAEDNKMERDDYEGCSVGTEFKGNCYELVAQNAIWDIAAEHCSSRGGALASIPNAYVDSFLKDLARGECAWVGGSDKGHEGVWVWPNGDKFTYTHWNDEEPDNDDHNGGPENCLVINSLKTVDGHWNDNACYYGRNYICQYPRSHVFDCSMYYEFLDNCYELVQTHATWDDAAQKCSSRGGALASIPDRAVNTFLENLAYGVPTWVGGSDKGHEGHWVWPNGDKFTYTHWNDEQPNNDDHNGGPENCLEINSQTQTVDGHWNDYSCYNLGKYICQFPTSGCTSGTVFFMGNCYELVTISTTWDVAAERCSSRGGALASVPNGDVDAFLQYLARGQRVWVGGSDKGHEGVWVWPNGDKFTYTNWNAEEPNNSGIDGRPENCLEINTAKTVDAHWDDYSCLYGESYICQFPITVNE